MRGDLVCDRGRWTLEGNQIDEAHSAAGELTSASARHGPTARPISGDNEACNDCGALRRTLPTLCKLTSPCRIAPTNRWYASLLSVSLNSCGTPKRMA